MMSLSDILHALILCILVDGHGCDTLYVPCEEHTQCRILFEYQSDGSEIEYLIWKLDRIEKAICYATGKTECLPYPKTDENLKFYIYREAGHITTEVIVSNATRAGDTRNPEKRWELFAYNGDSSSKVIYTCDFKLYNRVKDAVCNHEASEKGLRTKCIVSPGYPKRACVFNFNRQNYSTHLKANHIHTELSQNPPMYKTECYLDIPIESLITGRLVYNITIAPDFNNGTIVKTVLSIQRDITIEKPKISLVNCKDTVEEGKYIHCVCTREDNSDIKTRIYWNTNSADEKYFPRSALLEMMQTKIVNYTCIAKNDLGWTTFIEYSPTLKELTNKQHACPREKPYNCSTECYSDNEFCLDGQVYLCQPANIIMLQDWCENLTNPIEGIKSDPCKDACKRLLNSPEGYTNFEEIAIISSKFCTVVIALCALCYVIWIYGKREIPVKNCIPCILPKKTEYKVESSGVYLSDLLEAKMYINELEQMELKDVPACCNKQPKERVSYKKRSIDGDDCSEKEKHNNFISCGDFADNSTHCLAAHNVLDEIDTVKKFVVCTIDLTLKLIVGWVSKNRPQNDKLSEERGKSFTFTGTGRVVKVNKSDKPCNCPKHVSHGVFSKWTVDIATTTQVVFNEAEAKCTTAEVFDDEDKSVLKIKAMQGEWFHETDQPGECVVQCETCDEDLCDKLTSALTEQRRLSKHLPFNNDTFFVVSYPHGKSKHISFGRRSQVKDCSDVTCPGCYGASVLMLHRESNIFSPVHVGVHGKGNDFSTAGPPEKIPLLRPF